MEHRLFNVQQIARSNDAWRHSKLRINAVLTAPLLVALLWVLLLL